ncbi:MAG: HEAT repeat domain-containing protein [Deltaproteobacteria bacterium]|nr:HEAT repeat domain-containing protein [Deltaproteobacteria bacterium]
MFQPSPLRRTYAAALRDLTSSKPSVRASAAADLLSVGTDTPRAAADALAPLLDDRDSSVRTAALTTLGALDARHLLDAIAARLDDGESTVRQMAAVALSDLGGERALDALRGALRHRHDDVRYQALLGIVRASPSEGFAVALEAVDDADPWIASEGAEQLGYLLDPQVDPPFELSPGRARAGHRRPAPRLRRPRPVAAPGGGDRLHRPGARRGRGRRRAGDGLRPGDAYHPG